jgi:hypothetical protein
LGSFASRADLCSICFAALLGLDLDSRRLKTVPRLDAVREGALAMAAAMVLAPLGEAKAVL